MIGKLLFNKTEAVLGNDGVVLNIPVVFTDPVIEHSFEKNKRIYTGGISFVYDEVIYVMTQAIGGYLTKRGLFYSKIKDVRYYNTGWHAEIHIENPFVTVSICTKSGDDFIKHFERIRKI
jgi:hypothetical protein